jgi:hypothetical protein
MAALALSAGMVALVAAACSEGVTTPPKAPTAFAVGDPVTPPGAAVAGLVVVCKTGDVGGTIDVSGVEFGTSTGFTSVGSDYAIATGTCVEAARDESPQANGTTVTVSEDATANVTTTVTCVDNAANPCDPSSLSLNIIHGYLITYDNDEEEVIEQCTYTKGWYRNNGEETITDVDGRSAADAETIFDATPGKPGGVTFGGNNSLLNLYQQLLAALLNGGASGPQEVQDAIDDAQAGTGGAGLNITTTLTQQEISDLTAILSAYNEGSYEGFPHCDDEVSVIN